MTRENEVNAQTSEDRSVRAEQDASERASYRFDASKRVKHGKDFQLVYQFRARYYNDRMTICCRPTGEDKPARLGLSVSKKVGIAVVRVRWKRLIREAFRLQYASIPKGFDYIVIPKRQDAVPSYATIADDVLSLMKRAAKKALRFQENALAAQNGAPSAEDAQ